MAMFKQFSPENKFSPEDKFVPDYMALAIVHVSDHVPAHVDLKDTTIQVDLPSSDKMRFNINSMLVINEDSAYTMDNSELKGHMSRVTIKADNECGSVTLRPFHMFEEPQQYKDDVVRHVQFDPNCSSLKHADILELENTTGKDAFLVLACPCEKNVDDTPSLFLKDRTFISLYSADTHYLIFSSKLSAGEVLRMAVDREPQMEEYPDDYEPVVARIENLHPVEDYMDSVQATIAALGTVTEGRP